MRFSVIYDFDCPKTERVETFNPPRSQRRRGLWQCTEGDEQRGYDYLEGVWAGCKHRKWCALLDQDDFDAFVAHLGLVCEDVETMGSLGAPGFGLGWAPALSFRADRDDAIAGAYVTPVPADAREARRMRRRGWDRIRAEILGRYGADRRAA